MARLEEAVVAYRAALEEWTRERAPSDWSKTQNNLGYTLTLLGETSGDAMRFEEATGILWAALAEQRKMRDPKASYTADSLCRSLLGLGLSKRDRSLLLKAKAQCIAAIEGQAALGDRDVRETEANLANVEKALAEIH